MSNSITVDEMKRHIVSILPENASLDEFLYDAQCFGNMIVRINKDGKLHTFVTDRGEIYHDKVMLWDGYYHYKEKQDNFRKLLQVISKEMSNLI